MDEINERPESRRDVSKSRKPDTSEIIFDLRWYSRLVPNPEVRCLLDAYNVKERFNVCYDVPSTNRNVRMFASCESPASFLNRINSINRRMWTFFEVIIGSKAQKPYFDIDMPTQSLDDVESTAQLLINELIHTVVDTLSLRGHCVNVEQDVLLFSSHSSKKRSYHLVIDRVAFPNYVENRSFGISVIDQLPDNLAQFVDRSMWSRTQQFRLYLSQKPYSERPKIMVREWRVGDTRIVVKKPTCPLDLTTEFTASCVSWTPSCNILDPVTKQQPTMEPRQRCANDNPLPHGVPRAIVARCEPKLWQVFEIIKIDGSLISLRRKCSAYCSLCRRIHDSDNAFLVVTLYGRVDFHCHGTRRHVKYGPTSFPVCDVSDFVDTPVDQSLVTKTRASAIHQLQTPDVRATMSERLDNL